MAGPTVQTMQNAFDVLVQCAREGRRCPFNGTLGINSHVLRALSDRAYLRILIYRENWRVVEILAGEHAGKSTQRSPLGGSPYSIIDKTTPRRGRQQPSKPGLLK